jgi:hypothetical protein
MIIDKFSIHVIQWQDFGINFNELGQSGWGCIQVTESSAPAVESQQTHLISIQF